MIKVSVVIPVYNAAAFIAEAIASVQAQTLQNFELIIVNDGSTDNSADVISSFLKDERIKLISQPNAGVSAARNTGLKNCRGEFIALLDADDVFFPTNLERKTEALLADKNATWVYSNLIYIDERSEQCGKPSNAKEKDILENLLLWNGEVVPTICSNVVFRSSLLKDGLAFDPRFSTAADQDFAFRLAERYSAVFIPETLTKYRLLKNSMSRNITLMEKDHIAVYRKAQRAGLFSSASFRRKCFSNLYLILAGSWWVNGGNKRRGFIFMLKSVFTYPPNIGKVLAKLR